MEEKEAVLGMINFSNSLKKHKPPGGSLCKNTTMAEAVTTQGHMQLEALLDDTSKFSTGGMALIDDTGKLSTESMPPPPRGTNDYLRYMERKCALLEPDNDKLEMEVKTIELETRAKLASQLARVLTRQTQMPAGDVYSVDYSWSGSPGARAERVMLTGAGGRSSSCEGKQVFFFFFFFISLFTLDVQSAMSAVLPCYPAGAFTWCSIIHLK